MSSIDHTTTAHLDTPKERALRHDYELANAEVQVLKARLKRVRMIPLSEEAEAMFYWRNRTKIAEGLLRQVGLLNQYEELAEQMEAREVKP